MSYDTLEVSGASLRHLNHYAIADYFTRQKIDFASKSEKTKKQLLNANKITSNKFIPTVGGLLVFGITPEYHLQQSGISLTVFNGNTQTSAVRDKRTFLGPLPQQIDNALSALKANIPIASEIIGSKRIDVPNYPEWVLKELLINACVHRNYSIIGSQIRVFMFDNRIEFISHGPLPSTVKISELTTGISLARNPLLITLMEISVI